MIFQEGVHESALKYHHWISQLKYMHFDTEHVEIGPKMDDIAKIVWHCVKIAGDCVKEGMKLPKQT